MRTPVALLLVALALAVAACGGASGEETVRDAAAGDAQPAAVVAAEPVLDDYRGTPLAIVFFHPL